MKRSDIFVALAVLLIIVLIIVPLTPHLLDLLLIVSISMSLMILLMALYARDILEFSTFPTLLLLLTLFRLSLNISSTRLILSNGGNAGNVIETFGNFVVGSNLVVGVVVFLIIVIIQFIIITKGSERVAEVAARFTLDAMPGKQMSIDADLNAGAIDENQAQKRRAEIQKGADFYGAMDGASKFVKGDAIVGIIIVVINIVGGMIIGSMRLGGGSMPFDQVVQVYTLATVGDGLCSQIPALLISTSTGIIVTRSTADETFGQDLTKQLLSKPEVLYTLGGMVGLLSLIPGLPKLPMLIIALMLPLYGYSIMSKRKKTKAAEQMDQDEQVAKEKRKPESVTSLLQVDPLEMEFGYSIIPLVDSAQGGDLLDRVVMIRRQCALDLGVIVPVVRLRDNIQLPNNTYLIKIKGVEVAHGEIMQDHYLALRPSDVHEQIDGIETTDPTFGMPAVWILESNREKAEMKGYTTIDVPSVIATHLMETIKRHCHELLGRQQVQTLLDNLKSQQPALVDEIVPKLFSIGDVQKVLSNLLMEGISIRDLASILEVMGDYAGITRDTDLLTEHVRQSMKRALSRKFIPDGKANVILLDPALEQSITENIRKSEQGEYIVLAPDTIQSILKNTKAAIERSASLGNTPIILASPLVRRHFKQLSRQLDTDLVVLSYNELDQTVQIHSDGMVKA